MVKLKWINADNDFQGKIVGIIAGTPTDTLFGVNLLKHKKFNVIGLAISDSPQEQTRLQASDRDELTSEVLDAAILLRDHGAETLLIYCNSLSGAIDVGFVEKRAGIRVLTPFDAYARLAKRFSKIGLIAANCQSTANIERFILKINPDAMVFGFGNLGLVNDIEAGLPPDEIVSKHSLPDLCKILKDSGAEVVVLGCTHFPYFRAELSKRMVGVEIFEPSDELVKLL